MTHQPTSGTTSTTQQLTDAGVSIWLDDLSRTRLQTGDLQNLIDTRNVVGVTTNPSIFHGALSQGSRYDDDLVAMAARGLTPEQTVLELMAGDVRAACVLFEPAFAASDDVDGRASIEVSPLLAHDTAATVAQAQYLHDQVGHRGVYIKIPATAEGIGAIEESLAHGVSINVTLIFSLSRYREVLEAFLTGLERAQASGLDISKITSVASFFVSRVDTEVDRRLGLLSLEEETQIEVAALKGRAGIANARLAYELFEQTFATERAQALLRAGAHVQRPLWASTGVKDPSIRDTAYVEELAAPDTVNTMPGATLEATFDHAVVTPNAITGAYEVSREVLAGLAELGIDIDDVTDTLEREGVEKFNVAWADLLNIVATRLAE